MKCCQFKNAGKMQSAWFWNNAVNVKFFKRLILLKEFPVNIYHIMGTEKLQGIGNLDEVKTNSSFLMF